MSTVILDHENLTSDYTGFHPVGSMPAGALCVLVQRSGHPLQYVTSSDSGATWTAPTDLDSIPSNLTIGTIVHAEIVTGALWVWWLNPSGGADISLYSVKVGTPTTFGVLSANFAYSPFGLGPAGTADAVFDAGSGVFHVAKATGGASPIVGVFSTGGLGDIGANTGPIYRGTSWTGISIALSGSTLFLAFGASGAGKTFLYPIGFSGFAYSMGGQEMAASNAARVKVFAAGGNAFLLYSVGSALYSVERTGTNVYNASDNIGYVSASDWTAEAAGSTIYAFVRQASSQPNGEIYLYSRVTSWDSGIRLAGGDASGYQFPRCRASGSGSFDLVYLVGTSSPRTLIYYQAGASSAPAAPTGLTPSGYVGSTTVTYHATYSNPLAPADPPKARRVRRYDTDNTTLIWDSGMVAGGTAGILDAGTAMSYGHQYWWDAQDEDSLSAGGAGTAGSFSARVSFTPVQAGVVALTQLVAGTTSGSSPATITTPAITSLTFSWSQAQTHNANNWRLNVYDSTGTTKLQTVGPFAISPVLASGSSFTSLPFTIPGLANATTYKFEVEGQDEITAVWGTAARWTVTTAWTPPSPPAVVATVNDELGTISFAVVPGADAVNVGLRRSLKDANVWTDAPVSGVVTAISDLAPLNTPFDYQVWITNADGVPSAPVPLTNLTLGLAVDGDNGYWFNDASQPLIAKAVLGPFTDWSSGTNLSRPPRVTVSDPSGAKYSSEERRRIIGREAARQYRILRQSILTDGTIIDGTLTRDMMDAFDETGIDLVIREVGGEMYLGTINGFTKETEDPFNFIVKFGIREKGTFDAPVVVTS